MGRAIDTMLMARQKFPGAPASLDALCKRFDIDLSVRDKHGALLDSQLLADVYLELIGGRQTDLALVADSRLETPEDVAPRAQRASRPDLPGAQPTAEEIAAHEKFLDRLTDPIWRQ
jgi:DNA polymerase-3 subunit epsilon